MKEKLESGSRCKRSLSLDYSNTTTFMEQIRLLEETRIHWDNDQITTLETGVLAIDSRTNNPGVIARKCKELQRPQRVCILECARLNPGKVFLDRYVIILGLMEDVKVSENDPKPQTAVGIIKKIQVPCLIPLGEIVPGSASLVISDPLSIFPDMENISNISLIAVETDCEDEIEPEKVQSSSGVKPEKSPVASGSGLLRAGQRGRGRGSRGSGLRI